MESFEQLIQEYEPMIHKIMNSLHIFKNREEFYNDGLIALWEASKRYIPNKGKFSSYAYTYIKCYLLTELNKRNKDEQKCVKPKEEFWGTVEDLHCICPLEEEILLSYCSDLTPNQRKWVMYTAMFNLTVKEIAEKEKVSASAVKAWRMGAREKIKTRVIY